MGTKPRNILKDDVVATIFKHSQGPSRKIVSSLERENKQAKKQLVQEALGSYEKTITQTQKEVSCSTKDLIAVTEIGTENSAKTKSVRTQYRKEDFEEKFQDIVKVSKPIRKCKGKAVNTDITFQSCEITKSQNYIQYNEPITTDEGEATKDEDSDDESYHATSDSFDDSDEEETFDEEQPDKISSARYKASCILVMYCNTSKSLPCLISACKNMQTRNESNRRRCLRIESRIFLAFTTK